MNGKTNFLNLLLCYFVSSELNQISAQSQVTESSQFVNETATSTINTSALFNLQTHAFINEMFGPNYSSYMTVCNSFDCVEDTVNDSRHVDKVMIYYFTSSFLLDAYVSHFLGLVLDLFKLVNFHIVIDSLREYFVTDPFDLSIGTRYEDYIHDCLNQNQETSFDLLSIFCQKVVIIDYEHYKMLQRLYHKHLVVVVIKDAPVSVSLDFPMSYYETNKEKLLMMIHINNELPWLMDKSDLQLMIESYNRTSFVVRTVYYDMLKPYSTFVPVRSGLLLTESYKTPEFVIKSGRFPPLSVLRNIIKTSDRPVVCFFAGGLRYKHKQDGVEPNRLEMLNAFQDFSSCEIFSSDRGTLDGRKLSQREYIEILRQSQFVICPTGLNPETQRPHQAFDLGSIPLTLRVPDSFMDYLTDWVDYPGPLFDSWWQARLFLEDVVSGVISPNDLDIIQEEIRNWYSNYIYKSQLFVKTTLDNLTNDADKE